MQRASIDLGTNTCLLLVADWPIGQSEPTRVLADLATVVRLGQGVDQSKRLAPEAKARTLACLHIYAERARALGVDPGGVRCVATSQARDSADAPEFFAQVARETGFRFETISGEDEAKFTFSGALLQGMDPKVSAVIDIGGGSTEITAQGGGLSVDIGSVRYTERFLKSTLDAPVSDWQFWEAEAAIDRELAVFRGRAELIAPHLELVAVAGTATTLAAWHLGLKAFDAAAVDQVKLTRGDLHRMVEELKWRTPRERALLPGVDPGRADVLLAGAMILWRAHETLGFASCRVSTRGLRYGVLRYG